MGSDGLRPEPALIAQYQSQVHDALCTVSTEPIVEALEALRQVHGRRGTVFVLSPPEGGGTAERLAQELERGIAAGPFRFLLVRLPGTPRLVASWQNDWAYEDIYVRQLQGVAHPGDVAMAISPQGQSAGLARGLETARRAGAVGIGMVGFDGGLLREASNICLHVRCERVEQVEDVQLMLVHILSVTLRRLLGPGHEAAT